MTNEAAGGPLDIYNESPLGVEPQTLAETIAAAQAALDSLNRLGEAIDGCMTPLNLQLTAMAVGEAGDAIARELQSLRQARELIESDAPLARTLPNARQEWTKGRQEWAKGRRSDPGNPVLTPQEIIAAARHADDAKYGTTTYRSAIESFGGVPSIAARELRTLPPAPERRESETPDGEVGSVITALADQYRIE